MKSKTQPVGCRCEAIMLSFINICINYDMHRSACRCRVLVAQIASGCASGYMLPYNTLTNAFDSLVLSLTLSSLNQTFDENTH